MQHKRADAAGGKAPALRIERDASSSPPLPLSVSAGAGAALQHLHPGDRGHEAGGGDGLPAFPAHPGEEREEARRVPPQAAAAAGLLLPLWEARTGGTDSCARYDSCLAESQSSLISLNRFD